MTRVYDSEFVIGVPEYCGEIVQWSSGVDVCPIVLEKKNFGIVLEKKISKFLLFFWRFFPLVF